MIPTKYRGLLGEGGLEYHVITGELIGKDGAAHRLMSLNIIMISGGDGGEDGMLDCKPNLTPALYIALQIY